MSRSEGVTRLTLLPTQLRFLVVPLRIKLSVLASDTGTT